MGIKQSFDIQKCVQLLLFGCVLIFVGIGCKKSEGEGGISTKKLSSIYKDTIGGTFTWQHFYYLNNPNLPQTHIKMNDTTFPIVTLNDSDIVVLGNQLRYYDSIFYNGNIGKLNDTASNLRYSNKYALPYSTIYLSFDRNTDSVFFEYQVQFGISGIKGDSYATKITR